MNAVISMIRYIKQKSNQVGLILLSSSEQEMLLCSFVNFIVSFCSFTLLLTQLHMLENDLENCLLNNIYSSEFQMYVQLQHSNQPAWQTTLMFQLCLFVIWRPMLLPALFSHFLLIFDLFSNCCPFFCSVNVFEFDSFSCWLLLPDNRVVFLPKAYHFRNTFSNALILPAFQPNTYYAVGINKR